MLINTFIRNSNDEHMKKQLLLLVMFATSLLHAQVYFPTNKGVKTTKNTTVAFTNAKNLRNPH